MERQIVTSDDITRDTPLHAVDGEPILRLVVASPPRCHFVGGPVMCPVLCTGEHPGRTARANVFIGSGSGFL